MVLVTTALGNSGPEPPDSPWLLRPGQRASPQPVAVMGKVPEQEASVGLGPSRRSSAGKGEPSVPWTPKGWSTCHSCTEKRLLANLGTNVYPSGPLLILVGAKRNRTTTSNS